MAAQQKSGNEIALVVGWGIRYMIRIGERCEQQHPDRHKETMRALEVLIECTAPPQVARS